jgi:formylglycine-generating enzyme required for sulfatase activity
MRYFTGATFALGDGSATVTARPFCLDATEVTASAYAACVRAGACSATDLACSRSATYGNPERASHPMNCVSWIEADAYCRQAQRRLPTEAEWEWAARGGARARRYPWGDAAPANQACWDGKGNALGKGGRKETCPVGSHPDGDSADGISDLAGNVREWTSSKDGRFRVVRGGSWGDSLPDFVAVAFRGMNAPDERFELTGFRCAADPASTTAPLVARARAPSRPPPPRPVPVLQADELLIVFKARR